MFRCVVSVVCVDLFRTPRTFQRVIDLPFAPSPLIELGFVSPSTDWSGEITAVVYEVATGVWHVELGEWEAAITADEFRAELGPEWAELPKVA